MAPFTGVPSPQEQVALAIAPKVTAAISIVGSSYIVVDACKRCLRATSRNHTYHRLMIGLSVCDLFMSAGLFTSTWPMPRDTPNVWGASGTTQTCSLVGFFEQAGVGAVLYNGSLSTYYLLRIRYGWSTHRLAKAEIILHGLPIVFALSTMIASLALGLFNSGLFDCWIAQYPQGCVESWRSPDGQTTCVRGNNASLYQWVFDVIPKWLAVLVVTLNMFLTHRAVFLQEKKTLRYSNPEAHVPQWSLMPAQGSDSSWRLNDQESMREANDASSELRPAESSSRKLSGGANGSATSRHQLKLPISRRLADQSYLYVGALYLTYIPVIVTRAFELVHGFVYYEMLLTISITIPLQGFWNVLVYLRPRYIRERELRLKARKLSEQRRQQQQRHESNVGSAGPPEGASPRAASRCARFMPRLACWRIAESVQEHLSAVSQVVREGGLDDEEEDFDNETGFSVAGDLENIEEEQEDGSANSRP